MTDCANCGCPMTYVHISQMCSDCQRDPTSYEHFDEDKFIREDKILKAEGASEQFRADKLLKEMDEAHLMQINDHFRKMSKIGIYMFGVYFAVMGIYVAWEIW